MTLHDDGTQSWTSAVLDPGSADHPNAVVPILRSGVLAQQFCQSVVRANVEAVFERCFYVRSGDKFICVGEPDIGNGPITLIGDLGRLSNLGLQQGRSAAVCDQRIMIGDSICLALDQTESWRSPRWPICPSPIRLIDTCLALARRAAIEAPEESLARHVCGMPGTLRPLAPLARIACPRIAIFERWLSGVLDTGHAGVTAIEEAVQGLVGLGPGLTPSGDDFLMGALALLDAIDERHAHAALARAMSDPLLKLTTPLSACFLRAAAAGHVGEALHGAVSSVLMGDVESAAAAARKIGHSSGWDMMVGIIVTLAARLKRPAETHHLAFS
jgi:hypothetical protein